MEGDKEVGVQGRDRRKSLPPFGPGFLVVD